MKNDIDKYIANFPQDIQKILRRLRTVITKVAPKSEETIAYGIPTFDLDGSHLVHFAAFKNHIGFYPTPSAIVVFKNELSQYKQAKGSVQFPVDKPIPFALISKMVKFRVREVFEKAKAKKK